MLNEEDRARVSRENGAKSRGPKTDEGKQKSSVNATVHGAYSRSLRNLEKIRKMSASTSKDPDQPNHCSSSDTNKTESIEPKFRNNYRELFVLSKSI